MAISPKTSPALQRAKHFLSHAGIPILFILLLPFIPALRHCVHLSLSPSLIVDYALVLLTSAEAILCLYLFIRHRELRQHFNASVLYTMILFCACVEFSIFPDVGGDIKNCAIDFLILLSFISLCHLVLRRFSWVLNSIILMFACMAAYANHVYGIRCEAFSLAEILGASPADILIFITPLSVTCAVILLLVCAFVSYLFYRCVRKQSIAGTAVIALFCTLQAAQTGYYTSVFGRNNIRSLHNAFDVAKSFNTKIVTLCSTLPEADKATQHTQSEQDNQDCVIILHIGESVRADHCTFNGYERPTTPNICGQKANLINFADCTSVWPATTSATMALLTDACAKPDGNASEDFAPTSGALGDYLTHSGFNFYSFFDNLATQHNDKGCAVYEKLVSFFTRSAKENFYNDSNHGFDQIDRILDTLRTHAGTKQFLLINNTGSHFPYSHYPVESRLFTPADSNAYHHSPATNPEAAKNVINSYDNTIVATDHFIGQIIDSLKGKPYIYIYISDHGEYLGDHGLWMRNGNPQDYFTVPVCQVPFFFIISSEFESISEQHRQKVANIRHNSHMQVAQEHLFHTILGLLGISDPVYRAELDLSAPAPKPYTGPHPTRNGAAEDGKNWY